jgi:hypothetical protein
MAKSEADLFPFLFMGCWNQPGPKNSAELTPRDYVIDHILKHQTDIKQIILGGDNVYPRPLPGKKKNKDHEIDVFDEGIKQLLKLKKPIYTAFWNHNVIVEESTKPISLMKLHQMRAFGLEKTYYDIQFGNVQIIILDSNIIGEGESNEEYKHMLEWFQDRVRSLPHDHTYFLIQHDPYFTARVKGYGDLKHTDRFLEILFERPPIAILCADTHHFQHATITDISDPSNKIHQFIVGTGGANRDLHKPDFATHLFREKYLFENVEEVEGFGYLRIDGPHASACHFVKAFPWPPAAGGGRTRRRRRRHLKTRRNSY